MSTATFLAQRQQPRPCKDRKLTDTGITTKSSVKLGIVSSGNDWEQSSHAWQWLSQSYFASENGVPTNAIVRWSFVTLLWTRSDLGLIRNLLNVESLRVRSCPIITVYFIFKETIPGWTETICGVEQMWPTNDAKCRCRAPVVPRSAVITN